MQAMKHAFAMRSHLGDPGLCSTNSVHGEGLCFQDMQPILADMLSSVYAEGLRCCCPLMLASVTPCCSCSGSEPCSEVIEALNVGVHDARMATAATCDMSWATVSVRAQGHDL